jgi:hypothetical protein
MAMSGRVIPMGRLIVATDAGVYQNVLEFRFFEGRLSNLSTEQGGGDAVFSLALNSTKIKVYMCPSR